jgi:hypothetical protein
MLSNADCQWFKECFQFYPAWLEKYNAFDVKDSKILFVKTPQRAVRYQMHYTVL